MNIGYNNFVAVEKISSICDSSYAKIQSLIAAKRKQGLVLDCSCGRKVRTAIILECGQIALSTKGPDTIKLNIDDVKNRRMTGERQKEEAV